MYDCEKDTIDGLSWEELVKGFREGNSRVMGKLYDLYYVKLCNFCHYFLEDNHEAEDVVSQIFEQLLLNDINVARELRSLEDIANYLFVAAKSRCMNVLNRRKKTKVVYKECMDKTGYGVQEDLDLAFAQALGDMKLLQVVYNLPHRAIQVLQKFYFENKSYEEIAQEMGIARPTVSNLRAQGLTIVKRFLRREDFILHIFILLIATGAI